MNRSIPINIAGYCGMALIGAGTYQIADLGWSMLVVGAIMLSASIAGALKI